MLLELLAGFANGILFVLPGFIYMAIQANEPSAFALLSLIVDASCVRQLRHFWTAHCVLAACSLWLAQKYTQQREYPWSPLIVPDTDAQRLRKVRQLILMSLVFIALRWTDWLMMRDVHDRDTLAARTVVAAVAAALAALQMLFYARIGRWPCWLSCAQFTFALYMLHFNYRMWMVFGQMDVDREEVEAERRAVSMEP